MKQSVLETKVIEKFKKAIQNSGVSHAYLFTGGNKVLRKNTAFEIAAILNCKENTLNSPCRTCEACLKIFSLSHPDLYILEPDPNTIKIQAVRDLQKNLGYKKYEGKYKVIIIEEADKMTLQASNSLLKILEEPSPNIVFFLLAANKNNLLPTIISRCQHIYLSSDSQVVYLENFQNYLQKILSGDKYTALEIVSEIEKSEKDILDAFLDNLLKWYRDYLVLKEAGQEKLLIGINWKDSLTKYEINTEKAVKAIEKILETQKNLQNNLNKTLLLENLVLELAGEK